MFQLIDGRSHSRERVIRSHVGNQGGDWCCRTFALLRNGVDCDITGVGSVRLAVHRLDVEAIFDAVFNAVNGEDVGGVEWRFVVLFGFEW